MRRHSAPQVQVKAAGGVRTLDDLLHVRSLGVTRVGATATAVMIDEAIRRFGGAEVSGVGGKGNDTGGY
jgi:deoxyribose-phosphate aldolase